MVYAIFLCYNQINTVFREHIPHNEGGIFYATYNSVLFFKAGGS